MFSRHACSSVILLVLYIPFNLGCAGTKIAPTSAPGTASPGSLSLSTSTVKFGNVQVGSTKSISLTISNGAAQTTTIQLSQVVVSGQAFSTTGVMMPTSLAPGNSLTLTIVFSPSSVGNASGAVAISSTASPANISVALSGDGTGPGQLAVSPSQITFSAVAVGTSQTETGTLTAETSPITVSSANWQGTGFSLSGITLPITIAAGQSAPFIMTFAPQTVGTVSGSVSFVSDASNSPASESLVGTGLQQATQHTVDLSWSPDPSSVQGYYVYRGNKTGGPYTKISALLTAPSYVDSTISSGLTYYYVVTALGGGSIESGYSNEAVAIIP